MRLRKQSKPTEQPGDAFLRAVSSGPANRQAASGGQPAEDLSGLRKQLLESERRAAASGEAVRQMRGERDERLQQARDALAREREARIAAERRLDELDRPSVEAPSAPAPAAEPGQAGTGAPAEPPPQPMFPNGAEAQVPGDGAPEADWPTPWLAEEGRSKRGLFRRSRS